MTTQHTAQPDYGVEKFNPSTTQLPQGSSGSRQSAWLESLTASTSQHQHWWGCLESAGLPSLHSPGQEPPSSGQPWALPAWPRPSRQSHPTPSRHRPTPQERSAHGPALHHDTDETLPCNSSLDTQISPPGSRQCWLGSRRAKYLQMEGRKPISS